MNSKCSQALANTSVDGLSAGDVWRWGNLRWCISTVANQKTFRSPLAGGDTLHSGTYSLSVSLSVAQRTNESLLFLIFAFKLLINAEWTESICAKRTNANLKHAKMRPTAQKWNKWHSFWPQFVAHGCLGAAGVECWPKIEQLTLDLANTINFPRFFCVRVSLFGSAGCGACWTKVHVPNVYI